MPHQFMSIICLKCNKDYCPVCKPACPKCHTFDDADEKTLKIRSQMRRHGMLEKMN